MKKGALDNYMVVSGGRGTSMAIRLADYRQLVGQVLDVDDKYPMTEP